MQDGGLLWSGFYFYFHKEDFDPVRRHYAQAALAQGLKRLGAPLFSNAASPLFSSKPLRPEDGHTAVFVATEDTYAPDYAQWIGSYPARKIILSMADTGQWLPTPPDTVALMCHSSRFFALPGPRRPWSFGLTDERTALCGQPPAFDTRRPVILRNFRSSYSQSVRSALDLALVPHLEKHFTVDRSLSSGAGGFQAVASDHFERLRTSVGCLAYGGEYTLNLAGHPGVASTPMGALYRAARFEREPVVSRWDSWRFWESLACGCLTFHVDLDKYGCLLPEMPVAWKHYIGVDLEDPRGAVERLMDERPRWAEISAAGRAWALEHYSPEAAARRFLAHAASAPTPV
jgi:hypothetical protein